MAEASVAQSTPKQKVASVGAPQRADINDFGAQAQNTQTPVQNQQTVKPADAVVVQETKTTTTEVVSPDLSAFQPDAVQKYLKDTYGFTGNLDSLKTLTNAAPAQKILTPDEQKNITAQKEQRVLSRFFAEGGKVEDYVALKQIVEADPFDLSVSTLKSKYKSAGFTDEQIGEIMSEQYFQFTDEQIEDLSDADQKAYALAKKKYGTQELQGYASTLKVQAQREIDALHQEIDAEDLMAAKEAEFSSKIDESLSKLPRKITFELGDVQGQTLLPIQMDVNEADVQEIAATLKDPDQRQKLFYNEDNSMNVDRIADLLLRNKLLEQAVKASYFEGETRSVAKVRSVFSSSPHDLGVGGYRQPNGSGGKLVAVGQPQAVGSNPNRRKNAV